MSERSGSPEPHLYDPADSLAGLVAVTAEREAAMSSGAFDHDQVVHTAVVHGTVGDLTGAEADLQAADEPDPQDSGPKKSPMSVLVEWLVVVAVAIGSAMLVSGFVVKQYAVDGTSMVSTLSDGDRVLVNRLSYRLHDPNRGDVVVLHQFNGVAETDLIKRVIGLPGESVDIRDCQVFIDGRRLIEPYLDPQFASCTSADAVSFPFVVPAESVFVLGDNRNGSKDSRAFGAVSYDDIVGRAFVVIWPRADWRWL